MKFDGHELVFAHYVRQLCGISDILSSVRHDITGTCLVSGQGDARTASHRPIWYQCRKIDENSLIYQILMKISDIIS